MPVENPVDPGNLIRMGRKSRAATTSEGIPLDVLGVSRTKHLSTFNLNGNLAVLLFEFGVLRQPKACRFRMFSPPSTPGLWLRKFFRKETPQDILLPSGAEQTLGNDFPCTPQDEAMWSLIWSLPKEPSPGFVSLMNRIVSMTKCAVSWRALKGATTPSVDKIGSSWCGWWQCESSQKIRKLLDGTVPSDAKYTCSLWSNSSPSEKWKEKERSKEYSQHFIQPNVATTPLFLSPRMCNKLWRVGTMAYAEQ